MTAKKTTVDAAMSEDNVVEIKPMTRIEKWKTVGMHPAIPAVLTAVIGVASFVTVCAVISRKPDPNEVITPEMIAEDEAIAL